MQCAVARLFLQPLAPIAIGTLNLPAREPLFELWQSRQRGTSGIAQGRGRQIAEDEGQSWHGGIVTAMRLVLESDPQILTVRAYARGEIDIAGQKLHSPCIVSSARLITDWPVRSAASLDLAALEPLLALDPKVVLIGSDATDASATGMLRRALELRGIAFEVMNLGAACRTYNVLAQERREVVAGLFP
ncbi:MAG TPA: MTH938/NDUFAF3 family protein [Steroidobacteraceae bacterium]|nr:MTH938/NDUFAF3 family protein [Steroidobacteraceae bacterium]